MLSSQLSRGLPLFLEPSVSPTVTAASVTAASVTASHLVIITWSTSIGREHYEMAATVSPSGHRLTALQECGLHSLAYCHFTSHCSDRIHRESSVTYRKSDKCFTDNEI